MKIKKQTIAILFSPLLLLAIVAISMGSKEPLPTTTTDSPPAKIASSVTEKSLSSTTTTAHTTSQHHDTTSIPVTPSPQHETPTEAPATEYTYRMFRAPNDPGFASNWPLAKVAATTAWDTTIGNGQTIIAVIDSGYALNHEDLIDQWHQNSGETGMTQTGEPCWTGTPTQKQTNNCDDDQNSYIDDWRGWSFTKGDNNPQTGRDNSGGQGVQHGTQVASIAGARTNNGLGTASLAWNTKIMPLQSLDDEGLGYTSHITAAIYYAVNNGADVINLSLGTYANDPALRSAINYATTRNVIVVAAAGNCGDGQTAECAGIPAGSIAYPAAYPSVIAVGASTASDQRASFSSYGQALDIAAPGANLPMTASWTATHPTSHYSTNLYGTSFSSPLVASLVALIKSIRPSTTIGDISALLAATATKPSVMNGLSYSPTLGHGIMNAQAAIATAVQLNSGVSTPELFQAGSHISERTAPTGTFLSSGCSVSSGVPCTIELKATNGHTRWLPYQSTAGTGSTGWTWSTDNLDSSLWEIRARSGIHTSITPYVIMKR